VMINRLMRTGAMYVIRKLNDGVDAATIKVKATLSS